MGEFETVLSKSGNSKVFLVLVCILSLGFNLFASKVQADSKMDSSSSGISEDRMAILSDELYNNARLGSYLDWLRDRLKIKDILAHKLSKPVVDTVNNIILLRFNNVYFYQTVRNALYTIPVDSLLELSSWYGDVFGGKMAKIEVMANAPGTMQRAKRYYEKHFLREKTYLNRGGKLRLKRRELIERLLSEPHLVRLNVELQMRIAMKTRSFIQELQPMLHLDGEAGIDSLLYFKDKSALKDKITNETVQLFIYIYRGLTDEELVIYFDFLKSEPMVRFNRVLLKAFLKIL